MAHMGTLSQESNVSTKEACMDLCLGNSECKSFRHDALTQEIGIVNVLELLHFIKNLEIQVLTMF